MVDVRRGGSHLSDPRLGWHVAKNDLGVYIRAYAADSINISVEDARDIAHAILELTDE